MREELSFLCFLVGGHTCVFYMLLPMSLPVCHKTLQEFFFFSHSSSLKEVSVPDWLGGQYQTIYKITRIFQPSAQEYQRGLYCCLVLRPWVDFVKWEELGSCYCLRAKAVQQTKNLGDETVSSFQFSTVIHQNPCELSKT